MERSSRARLVLVLTGPAILVAFLAAESLASYDFTFRTEVYAVQTAVISTAVFQTVLENTGTQGDSIGLELVKTLPVGWQADYCLQGGCYLGIKKKYFYFAPGQSDTIIVDIFTGATADMGLLALKGTMQSQPSVTHSETFAGFANIPSIMLVDDDAGQAYQTYLLNAIQNAGYKARVWNTTTLGRPGVLQLDSYWGVFWTTADGNATYLTSADETDMAGYLDYGGNLFLASMGFLSSRMGPSTFTTDYLNIASWTGNTGGTPMVGLTGDPISDGMSLPLGSTPFPSDSSDSMVLTAGSDQVFYCATGIKGLKSDENGHRVVFLAFPFEGVSTGDPDPNNQNQLVARVLDWFDPPVAGVPTPTLPEGRLALSPNFPNPFSTATTISFRVPGGASSADVAVYNTSGQVVRSLATGPVGSGETSVMWDGRDAHGATVAPGVYFCKLSAGGASVLTKMVVVK